MGLNCEMNTVEFMAPHVKYPLLSEYSTTYLSPTELAYSLVLDILQVSPDFQTGYIVNRLGI